MSHEISVYSEPIETSKGDILCDLVDLYDPEETDSYHGYFTFHDDMVFENREAAHDWLKQYFGQYDDHAVKFKGTDGKLYWLIKTEYHC